MIVSATIAFVAFNIGQTVARSDVVIAMFCSDVIANTTLTILQPDGIAVITWRTQIASSTERVVQAMNTFTRYAVARARNRLIDVTRALARFAKFAFNFRLAKESVGAALTLVSCVAWFAVATKIKWKVKQWENVYLECLLPDTVAVR